MKVLNRENTRTWILLIWQANICIKKKIILLQASYHVGLIQCLLPVVQFFLKESLLLTEQLLQQDIITYDARHAELQLIGSLPIPLGIQTNNGSKLLFSHDKLMFHLVIFQVYHLLSEGSLCAIYLLQPLYREDWDKRGKDECRG